MLFSTLTFPGVVLHELGHLLFCRIYNLRVHKYCLFRFGNPSGYVAHEVGTLESTFAACFGPLFLNTFAAAAVFFFTALASGPLALALMWLGVSIGIHALPSHGDGASLWNHTKEAWKKGYRLAAFYVPFAGFIYVGARLMPWSGLLFGIGVAVASANIFNVPINYAIYGVAMIEFKHGDATLVGNADALFDDYWIQNVTSTNAIPLNFVNRSRDHVIVLAYAEPKTGLQHCYRWVVPDRKIATWVGTYALDIGDAQPLNDVECMGMFEKLEPRQ